MSDGTICVTQSVRRTASMSLRPSITPLPTVALGGFLLLIMLAMEILVIKPAPAKKPKPGSQPPAVEIRPPGNMENQPTLWT